MALLSWKEAIEGIGIVSIVASLVFVGLQIKQDQNLARAQLGSETSEYVSEIYLMMADREFSSTFAKMLQEPENLSSQEMVQLNGVLAAVAELIFRECYLFDRGVYAECTSFIEVHGERFFGSRYAQTWWRYNRPPSLYGLTQEFDSVIEDIDENATMEMLEATRSEL
ncbi:MAG: hypothetical protein ABJ084_03810 [Halioglobus sp.]